MSGDCDECQEQRLSLQRYPRDRDTLSLSRLLASSSQSLAVAGGNALSLEGRVSPQIQTRSAVYQPGDQLEQEADRVAKQVTGESISAAGPLWNAITLTEPRIQRAPAGEVNSEDTLAGSAANEAVDEPATEAPTEATDSAAPSGLIVEDDVEPGPGQMRKNEFIDELRTAMCAAADAELAAVGRSTEGCPYMEFWIDYYRGRSIQQGERTLRRYAPETAGVSKARDYIPLVAERVRRAVAEWAATGRIAGVPDEASGQVSEAGAMAEGGGVPAATGEVQFKRRDGRQTRSSDPPAIGSQLGAGNSLDGNLRSKMESAFGHDFSQVRIHTDNQASRLSTDLNARAFTLGNDVAFAAGEYQPGTLVGDALIAHELAHVVQQGGAKEFVAPRQAEGGGADSMEEEADQSAVNAVVSIWSGAKVGLKGISTSAMPRLRSGLKLQRCHCELTKPTPTLKITELKTPETQHCGGVEWPIQFSLTGMKSKTSGWIVQQVNTTFDVKDCDNQPIDVLARTKEMVRLGFKTTPGGFSVTEPTDPSNWPFSEAWNVEKGVIHVGDTSAVHKNDTYRVVPMGPIAGLPETKGSVSVTGDADYFDCGSLPSNFAPGKPPVKGLPIARPPVALTGGSGPVAHNIAIRWNCCPGSPAADQKTVVVSKTP